MITTLYIKEHKESGLKYFGKTTKSDVDSYDGSGKYWKRHLKEHGKNVKTIWSEHFENKELLQEFAEFFSDFFDIVKSDNWANLKPENGLDGWVIGQKHDPETKLSGMRGKKHSTETKLKMSLARIGKKLSEEHKAKLRIPKSDIAKQNISKGRMGFKHSTETKLKIGNSVKYGKTVDGASFGAILEQ
jgi:hypothetical protein